MPGTGKTTCFKIAKQLVDAMGVGIVISTAYTGIAASLVDGLLFLSTFKYNQKRSPTSNLNDIKDSAIDEMRRKIQAGKLVILLIDECSQIPLEWIATLDRRLRQATGLDAHFGGVMCIFGGDFHQIESMSGTGVPKGMMLFAEKNDQCVTKIGTSAHAGCLLVKEMKCLQLVDIVRSKDPTHTDFVDRMSDGNPPSMEDLKSIQPITNIELRDPEWLDATFIVCTNLERRIIIHERVQQYAKHHGVPILRWLAKLEDNVDPAQIHKDECVHWEFFVPYVLGYLLLNLNSYLKLARGTPVKYYSVTFIDDKVRKRVEDRLKRAKPGEFVTLDEPPDSIQVTPVDEECRMRCSTLFQSLEKQEIDCNEPGKPPTQTQKVFANYKNDPVIPIPREKTSADWKSYIVQDKNCSLARIKIQPRFAVDMAFAMTPEKAQGCTMKKVVAVFQKRLGISKQFDLARFLVTISRVELGKHLRLLLSGDPTCKSTWGSLHYLTKLKANEDVMCFLAGFDSNDEGACKTWNAEDALKCRNDRLEARSSTSKRKKRFPMPGVI
jgi:hypothetical protein